MASFHAGISGHGLRSVEPLFDLASLESWTPNTIVLQEAGTRWWRRTRRHLAKRGFPLLAALVFVLVFVSCQGPLLLRNTIDKLFAGLQGNDYWINKSAPKHGLLLSPEHIHEYAAQGETPPEIDITCKGYEGESNVDVLRNWADKIHTRFNLIDDALTLAGYSSEDLFTLPPDLQHFKNSLFYHIVELQPVRAMVHDRDIKSFINEIASDVSLLRPSNRTELEDLMARPDLEAMLRAKTIIAGNNSYYENQIENSWTQVGSFLRHWRNAESFYRPWGPIRILPGLSQSAEIIMIESKRLWETEYLDTIERGLSDRECFLRENKNYAWRLISHITDFVDREATNMVVFSGLRRDGPFAMKWFKKLHEALDPKTWQVPVDPTHAYLKKELLGNTGGHFKDVYQGDNIWSHELHRYVSLEDAAYSREVRASWAQAALQPAIKAKNKFVKASSRVSNTIINAWGVTHRHLF